MKDFRHIHGALSLETIESKPVFDGDQIRVLEIEEKNRAKEIIEEFMVAANGVTTRYLTANKFPSIRRVVRVPKRWDRIVEIAAEYKFRLPDVPDSKALEEFLVKQKAADPLRFPDLSLAVIKLLGSGEYIAEFPDGDDASGHFGLALWRFAMGSCSAAQSSAKAPGTRSTPRLAAVKPVPNPVTVPLPPNTRLPLCDPIYP